MCDSHVESAVFGLNETAVCRVMDGMFGDSQEDEEAVEDELQFFAYVQDEVLEVKILDMTKASGLHEKKILFFSVLFCASSSSGAHKTMK